MGMRITKIQAPDGSEIYIQYDERDSNEFYAVGITDDILERTRRFQESVEKIVEGYALVVLDKVQKGLEKGPKPSKVNLEFGIQAGGEAGLPFVAKGTIDANIKVSLEWQMS
jgi:NTP-dependent ternary system trypsin peptidase co-occuring protein